MRIRDWVRPWNWSTRRWVLTLIVGFVISPFLTRWICLWQVPDVPLSFDVEEFLAAENVSDEDDAYVHYREAARLMGVVGAKWAGRPSDSKAIFEAESALMWNSNSPWDPRLEQWLDDNRPALEEFRRGGENRYAKGPSLRTADATLMLTTHNEIRSLAKLAELEGLRCEKSGDLQAAFLWHSAALKCARHAETPRLAICRLVAMSIRRIASNKIAHWSENPSLTREQLQQARLDIQSEASRRAPQSDFSKGEYLIARNTIQRPDAEVYLLPFLNRGIAGHPSLLPFKRFGLWACGQPEIVMRVQRQLLVNNRDCIDLPLSRRRKTVNCKNAVVFEADPVGSRLWSWFSPMRLRRMLDDSLFRLNSDIAWLSSKHFDQGVNEEEAKLVALDVVLALQQFHRDSGEFPLALEQLLPNYLTTIPLDPMSVPAVPLKYRRDSPDVAAVWSIGCDGTDDGGDVQISDRADKDAGYRFRFKRNAKDESTDGTRDGPELEVSK